MWDLSEARLTNIFNNGPERPRVVPAQPQPNANAANIANFGLGGLNFGGQNFGAGLGMPHAFFSMHYHSEFMV